MVRPADTVRTELDCSAMDQVLDVTQDGRTIKDEYFRLPYIDDGTEDVPKTVRNHVVCTRGLRFIFGFGRSRYEQILKVSWNSAIFPLHKAVEKTDYNSVENDTRKLEPLVSHFEYHKNLGEVRATRVVSTFIDGMVGHNNRDASLDVTYLPICTGYRSCYRRYMSSLGYIAETTATGMFKIRKEDGSAVDTGEFVSFPTYHTKWKRDYPNLKVSRPVEDICNLCYTFAHHQKFFSDHMRRCGGTTTTRIRTLWMSLPALPEVSTSTVQSAHQTRWQRRRSR